MSFRIFQSTKAVKQVLQEKNTNKKIELGVKNVLTLGLPILIIVASRLVPHLPNFTAVGAMALFAGAVFGLTWRGLLIPFVALLVSDMVLGFHDTIFYVYGAFALNILAGALFLKRPKISSVLPVCLVTSVNFFLITNFGVWQASGFYSRNLSGLVDSYVMGLPFLKYEILGDMFYSGLLFLGYSLLQQRGSKAVKI